MAIKSLLIKSHRCVLLKISTTELVSSWHYFRQVARTEVSSRVETTCCSKAVIKIRILYRKTGDGALLTSRQWRKVMRQIIRLIHIGGIGKSVILVPK